MHGTLVRGSMDIEKEISRKRHTDIDSWYIG